MAEAANCLATQCMGNVGCREVMAMRRSDQFCWGAVLIGTVKVKWGEEPQSLVQSWPVKQM